jgi:hypothetical protein
MPLGCDAFLAFTLALMLLVWLRLHLRGEGRSWRSALLVGALGGLAASAKYNGALGLLAFLGYIILSNARLRYPKALLAGTVAFAVFCMINPVMLDDPILALHDILARRIQIIALHNHKQGPLPFLALLQASFPAWPIIVLIGAALWRCRREPWFAPVAWWGLTLALGTWFTIDQPYARYRAPIELGFYVPFGIALAAPLKNRSRSIAGPAYFPVHRQ